MIIFPPVTVVQAVVGSIVCAFRRLKKPKCREMNARGYALHSVCPQLPFFPHTPKGVKRYNRRFSELRGHKRCQAHVGEHVGDIVDPAPSRTSAAS